jgi:hypothetical protein
MDQSTTTGGQMVTSPKGVPPPRPPPRIGIPRSNSAASDISDTTANDNLQDAALETSSQSSADDMGSVGENDAAFIQESEVLSSSERENYSPYSQSPVSGSPTVRAITGNNLFNKTNNKATPPVPKRTGFTSNSSSLRSSSGR